MMRGQKVRASRSGQYPPAPGRMPANRSSVSRLIQYALRWAPSLHALQEWEGHVLEVRKHDFLARLVDLTASASMQGKKL